MYTPSIRVVPFPISTARRKRDLMLFNKPRILAVITTAFVVVCGATSSVLAQTPGTAGVCDAVLIQDVDLLTLSRVEQLSWLKMINQSSYDKASLNTGAGAVFDGVPFNGHEEATHDAGEHLMSQENYNFNLDEARAIFRRHLGADKVAAWEKCVTKDAVGVTISFKDEKASGATARLYYNGVTTTSGVTFELQLEGGKIGGKSKVSHKLYSGGAYSFSVKRDKPTSPITAIVNGVEAQITDSAVSFPILPPLGAGHGVVACIQNQLLSAHRPVTASRFPESANRVTDGDKSPGNWNSLAQPPQWVEIDLGGPRTITSIRFNPEQLDGPSKHLITGFHPDGQEIVLGYLEGLTASGVESEVHMTPAGGVRGISKVKVLTLISGGDGAVSWREIEVYGCPN